MKIEKFKKVIYLVLHLVMQIVFSKIQFFGIFCVGLPFAFSKLFLNTNIFAITGFYFLSRLFLFNEISWILITGYEIVFLTLFYFAKEFLKTEKKIFVCEVFVLLSNILFIYFNLNNKNFIFISILSVVFQMISFLYFYKFNLVYKNKMVFYKFSRSDYFVFSIMIFLLSYGIFSFEFLRNNLGFFIVCLYIVFSAKILPIDRFLLSSIVVAIGSLFFGNELFIFCIIFSILISLIKDFNKYFYSALGLLILSFLVIIFKIYNIFHIISLLFAVFIYILIPNKFISKISESLEADAFEIVFRQHQECQISDVKNKLFLMADTLKDMQSSFKFLLVGKIDRQKACEELSSDIIKKCCNECENYRFCFMENINKRKMFENLLSRAIDNKSISNLEISNGIQAYCNKSGIIASEINQISKLFLSYESAMKTQDESKLLISSELENFSNIFKNFAKNIKKSSKINTKISKILKENFINNLIDVKECMIFERESGIESINIVLSNEMVFKKEVIDTISKTIKNIVEIKKITHLEKSGFSLVSFIPKSKIKVQFSISTKAKETQNGDNSVVVKLSENKYFVAIADGMGHGEMANKMSGIVINLIRCMFEVGLDDELIIDSVNKLLIPTGLDYFSTLDACVVDLEKYMCSFIKLGSSVSVLKHKDTSEIISSKSLPIGIVKNIKPTVVRKQISEGEMIFLASDGVVDSFQSVESYKTFINDSKIYNVQKFLDDVIFDAENMNKNHIDDMTIIGINLLKN